MSASDSFICSTCRISFKYDYFGNKPPQYKTLEVKEEVYSIRDPFTNSKGCILLGSNCLSCNKPVCISNECSIFYRQRYCLGCAKNDFKCFPKEIQCEISKRIS